MENENNSLITKEFLQQKRKSQYYQIKKRQAKRDIDIANGLEKTQILFPVVHKSKLSKTNFDYKHNYIIKSYIKNREMAEYILTQEYSCTCVGSCNKNQCECVQNHIQLYECNSNCACSLDNCENRLIQNGISKHLKVDFISSSKGFGVFSGESIAKGEFICEYVGQIVSKDQAMEKIQMNFVMKTANYVMQIRENYQNMTINTFIDAEEKGNVSRFLNHSCDPNLYFDIIRVEHFIPQLAFFAKRDIKDNEELTFSYADMGMNHNDSKEKGSYKSCLCGARDCCKFLPS